MAESLSDPLRISHKAIASALKADIRKDLGVRIPRFPHLQYFPVAFSVFVQFPLDKPIPFPLVKKIVSFQVKESQMKRS